MSQEWSLTPRLLEDHVFSALPLVPLDNESFSALRDPILTLQAYLEAILDLDALTPILDLSEIPKEVFDECSKSFKGEKLFWYSLNRNEVEQGFACIGGSELKDATYIAYKLPMQSGRGICQNSELEEKIKWKTIYDKIEQSTLVELANAVAPVIKRFSALSTVVSYEGRSLVESRSLASDKDLTHISRALGFFVSVKNIQEYIDEDTELPDGGRIFIQQVCTLAERASDYARELQTRNPGAVKSILSSLTEQSMRIHLSQPEDHEILAKMIAPTMRFLFGKGASLLVKCSPEEQFDLFDELVEKCDEFDQRCLRVALALKIAGVSIDEAPQKATNSTLTS